MEWFQIISIFTILMVKLETPHAQSDINVLYTLENFVTGDDRVFNTSLKMITDRQTMMQIMDEAAVIDNRYRYTTNEHDEFGHYVTSINGIYEDVNLQTYWAFCRRNTYPENGDCFLNVGISTYYPYDGEHVVFKYVHWDYTLPQCPDP